MSSCLHVFVLSGNLLIVFTNSSWRAFARLSAILFIYSFICSFIPLFFTQRLVLFWVFCLVASGDQKFIDT